METVLGILLGIGLAAACGFRIFVPFLVLGVAAQAGHLPLSSGFEWIASPGALIAFGAATVLEAAAYFVPWLDHALDALSTPVTVVAGTVATAAVVTDLPPLLKWTLAVIAGGGVAGIVKGGTAVTRTVSTATTGGFANWVLAGSELAGSVVTSVTAVLVPVLGAVLGVVVLIVAVRVLRRTRGTANG